MPPSIRGRRVFSGIQPSGNLTLGNYLGAIKAWVALQEEAECFFSIVDLHALTSTQDPALLRQRCLDFACLYLACGIDPEWSVLFFQSHVPAHAQLAWLLACTARMGELGRMTQYKEKARRSPKNVNAGLFTYPVLMAADILLYNAELVPVGEDQKQHVELARDLALRFNGTWGPVFTVPEVLIGASGARVRSLSDPSRKMSKSDDDPRGTIALLDSPDAVRSKVKAAVTGSGRGFGAEDGSPGVENLVSIYAGVSGMTSAAVAAAFDGRGYAAFKEELADRLVAFLEPLQKAYADLRRDEGRILALLSHGARTAAARAEATLQRAYDAVGLIRL